MSVETYLVDMLQEKQRQEAPLPKVTVRLEFDEFENLKKIAKTLEVTPTKAADGLLGAAIDQALAFLQITQGEERTDEEKAEGMRLMKGMVS